MVHRRWLCQCHGHGGAGERRSNERTRAEDVTTEFEFQQLPPSCSSTSTRRALSREDAAAAPLGVGRRYGAMRVRAVMILSWGVRQAESRECGRRPHSRLTVRPQASDTRAREHQSHLPADHRERGAVELLGGRAPAGASPAAQPARSPPPTSSPCGDGPVWHIDRFRAPRA